ncbi:MAG: M48 family metalloprotease, partial [Methylococcales bacterium]|nr:M48 family metalloprotease [Methylococcales bacterium]
MNESTVGEFLKPKVVLKKGLSAEMATKYKQLFLQLGLHLVILSDSNSLQNTPKLNKEEINIPKTLEDFEHLLDGSVPKVKISVKYKLGLFLAILASTLAPLIYLGIMSGLVVCVVMYVDLLPDILSEISNATGKAAVIIIPIFIPSVLLLFLIKPLFATHLDSKQYTLKRSQFPALFNLVEIMCKKIGVPIPKKITLNNEVNASASAEQGLLSLMRGDLKLTVGLPLITGMNIRQFIGVLAHEFGHFAQPFAMTTYYLVNTINYWFGSRAYQPDTWDNRLDSWLEKADWHIIVTIAILGAQFSIMLTRKLFSGLYLLNFKSTQFMSRNMEYDADAYESIFSGSSHFEETAMQLRKLAYADQEIQEINRSAWNENKLLEDMPFAIAYLAGNYDPNVDETIKKSMQDTKTNVWDSHPADNDRIKHVLKRNDSAIVTDEYPTHLLCSDIKNLCQKLTLISYRQYGIKDPEQYINKNSAILNSDKQKQNASLALDNFFNKNFYGRFLNFEAIKDKDSAPQTIEETINKLREQLVEYEVNSKKHQELTEKYSLMSLGATYIKDKVNIDNSQFHLTHTELNEIDSSINSTRAEISKLDEKLKVTDQLFSHRLLHDSNLMDSEQLKQFEFKLNVLKQIEKLSDKIFNLQHYYIILESLLRNDEEFLEQVKESINQHAQYCLEDAKNISILSKQIANGRENDKTLYDFIQSWCNEIPEQYNPNNIQETIDFSSQVIGAIKYHYYWVLADICEIALSVETDNNIAPIRLVA